MSAEQSARRAAAEPSYFVMKCDGVSPAAMVRRQTKWPGMPWMNGALITREVPSPVTYAADPSYRGELLAMYNDAIPIMRDDLLEALREAGVDNQQTFPALVTDVDGRPHTDYKAVN